MATLTAILQAIIGFFSFWKSVKPAPIDSEQAAQKQAEEDKKTYEDTGRPV